MEKERRKVGNEGEGGGERQAQNTLRWVFTLQDMLQRCVLGFI